MVLGRTLFMSTVGAERCTENDLGEHRGRRGGATSRMRGFVDGMALGRDLVLEA